MRSRSTTSASAACCNNASLYSLHGDGERASGGNSSGITTGSGGAPAGGSGGSAAKSGGASGSLGGAGVNQKC